MTRGRGGEATPAGGNSVTPRAAFWRALCVWVLTLAVAAAALIYNRVHPLPPELGGGTGNAVTGTVAVAFIVGFATVGALLAWKRPVNPIGWLLSAAGLSYAVGAAGLLLLQFPRTRAWGNWDGWEFFFDDGMLVFSGPAWAAFVSVLSLSGGVGGVERGEVNGLVYPGGPIGAGVRVRAPFGQFPSPADASNLQNAASSGAVALVPIAIGIAI